MVPINKRLTLVNLTKKKSRKIVGIVIHWVGCVSDKNLADGDASAENNGNYFYNVDRGASAHYFVDSDTIVQVVEDNDIAWHCGTSGTYFHPTLRNANTIGIEMCLEPNGGISMTVLRNTMELVQMLMKKYGINPENVVRHYDITHKLCPAPYVDAEAWNTLHAYLTSTEAQVVKGNPYKEPTKVLKYSRLTQNVAQEGVKWLQWELAQVGYSITVDGKFGAHTLSCLKAFQSKYPATYSPAKEPDGFCGSITRSYLKAV